MPEPTDEQFVMDEDFDAQAEFLRSLGLDPDTATHADLLAALPLSRPAERVLMTEPHDGHGSNETCPGCPHSRPGTPAGGESDG